MRYSDANGDGCPGICSVDDDGDGQIDECPDVVPPGAQCAYDDDENGYVDDINGYSFREGDYDLPYDDDVAPWDRNGHGMHVAGIIAAVGNNGIGVTGVNWRCRIVALKFLGSQNTGSTADAVEALAYAIANGILVSNHSYGPKQLVGGGTASSQSLADMTIAARYTKNDSAVMLTHDSVFSIEPRSTVFLRNKRTVRGAHAPVRLTGGHVFAECFCEHDRAPLHPAMPLNAAHHTIPESATEQTPYSRSECSGAPVGGAR